MSGSEAASSHLRGVASSAEHELDDYLRHAPAALYQLHLSADGSLRFTFVSPNVTDLFGVVADELMADFERVFEAIHPDDVASLRTAIASSMLDRTRFDASFRVLAPRGTRWVRAMATVVPQADGSLISYGVVIDVTDSFSERELLERELRVRSALVELTHDLLARELDERFYQHLLERAVPIVPGAEAGSILVREEGDRFRFVAAVGFDLDELKRVSVSGLETLVGPGTRARIINYTDANLVDRPDEAAALRLHGRIDEIASTLVVPVEVGDVVVAYLNLDSFSAGDAFSTRALDVADALARQVAMALQRLDLEQRLIHAAIHDPLTGVFNRTVWRHRIAQSFAAAKRHGRRIGVLVIDLDGFKGVNDAHGHHTGDDLLVEVARRLRGIVRTDDTLARIGGDEFVLLVEQPIDDGIARQIATKVILELSQPYDLAGTAISVGASVGIALYPDHADDADTLQVRADDALYAAKHGGRGRYALAAPR